MRSYFFTFGLCMALGSTLVGCNVFKTLDTPKGDSQILAAAHSCLDEGNYTCATQYYLQLSSSLNDTKYSEMAVAKLAESGIPVGTFAMAVLKSSSNIGKLITNFTNALSYQASSSLRLELFHNYQTTLNIQNTQLQGVLRLITTLTLIAEIFAEDATIPGNYQATDLVVDPTACRSAPDPLTAIATEFSNCSGNPTKKLISGTTIPTLATATDADIEDLANSGAPTLHMIAACINEVQTALALMSSQSKLITSLSSFFSQYSSQVANAAISPGNNHASPGFLYLLLYLGIGSQS